MLKVDILSRRRLDTSTCLRLRTSLCYNPSMERITLAIFQAEGVEVSTEGGMCYNIATLGLEESRVGWPKSGFIFVRPATQPTT